MRHAAAALVAALPVATALAQDGAFAWGSDFAAARAAAGKEHKPLLVLFRCER